MLSRLFAKPWLLLAIFALLMVGFGWQSSRFEINASADTLIADNNELYIRSQKVNQRFAPEEFLLIAYQPHKGSVFSSQSLADIQTISEQVGKLERVQTVRSVLNVPLLTQANTLSTNLKVDEFTQKSLQLSSSELQKIFTGHPIYEGLIVNPEQTATGVQVLFKPEPELVKLEGQILEFKSLALQRELTEEEQQQLTELRAQAEPIERKLRDLRNQEIAQLRTILAEFEDDADLYLGGVHVLGYQLINIIQHDLVVFGSIIAGVICLLLLLLFRRWQWLFISVICCACNLLVTVGLFGLLGFKATVISANFIALQLILSLAIVIHLIVQYRETIDNSPQASQRELVLQTLKEKLAPCFFAGFTTSVGFASLLLSDIKPVSSFGWMMVAAMGVTLLCTLLLFPALLLVTRKLESHSPGSLITAPILALEYASLKHGILVILLFLAAFIASLVGITRLDVENSFIDYFDQDTQVHKELTFIDQKFGGSTPLDIIYTPPPGERSDSQLILRALDVQNTHRIQKTLDAMPAMGTTLSLVNFTKLARQINNNKPLTEYELNSIYLLLDEDLRKDLFGSFLIQPPPQLRISARVQDTHPELNRAEFLQTIHKQIQSLGIPPEQYQLSNLFVLYQDMLEQLFRSQILTLGAVFAALTFAFLLIFRSLRVALVAITPNIVSALSVLGIMGWAGIPLDFMTITIAAIAMGIAVDDTIHYTHRYLHELRHNEPGEALTNTHRSVGFALVYTTAIITIGFCLLMFSNFVPGVYFGLLTGLAVLIALIADLTLLPVLLARFVAVGKKA